MPQYNERHFIIYDQEQRNVTFYTKYIHYFKKLKEKKKKEKKKKKKTEREKKNIHTRVTQVSQTLPLENAKFVCRVTLKAKKCYAFSEANFFHSECRLHS